LNTTGNCLPAMRRYSFVLFLRATGSAFFFTIQPFLLLFRPVTLVSGLTWSRHSRRNVIARAKFALLLLHDRIVHMDVVEDGGQILMTQEFLQAKRIIALEQIVHRKRMPQDMRADSLACNLSSLFEALDEHLHPIFGERLAGFREKQMIFSATSPISL